MVGREEVIEKRRFGSSREHCGVSFARIPLPVARNAMLCREPLPRGAAICASSHHQAASLRVPLLQLTDNGRIKSSAALFSGRRYLSHTFAAISSIFYQKVFAVSATAATTFFFSLVNARFASSSRLYRISSMGSSIRSPPFQPDSSIAFISSTLCMPSSPRTNREPCPNIAAAKLLMMPAC